MQYRHSLIDDDTTSRHLPVTSIRFLSGDETQAENRLMATCKLLLLLLLLLLGILLLFLLLLLLPKPC